MINEWQSTMDNLSDAYYLVQLIVRQIVIFLRDFIFYKFTWFASTAEDFDNANAKIQNIAPQHTAVDLLVLLIVCGLLFVFIMFSTNSPNDEESSCGVADIIMIPFKGEAWSSWPSRFANLQLTRYFHACGDFFDLQDVVSKMQDIPKPAKSRRRAPSQSRTAVYDTRSSYSFQHSRAQTKTLTSCLNFKSSPSPRGWLVRCTRSGHIYGKYPI